MRGYAWALAATAACTLAGMAMRERFDLVNIAMVYLLGVVVVALRFLVGEGRATSSVGSLAEILPRLIGSLVIGPARAIAAFGTPGIITAPWAINSRSLLLMLFVRKMTKHK